MAGTTFKMTKLVGESDAGIEDAVKTALETSATKVHGQTWCHVTDIRANINEQGGVDRWQVALEVAFKVDDA
jgi:flavin-binding protein dodecin